MGGTTTLLLVVAILATFCSAHPSSVQYSSTKAEAKAASEAEARSEAANSFSTSLLGRDGVTRHLSVDRKAKAAAESKAQAKANSEKNQALITLPNGQVVSKFDSAQGWETKTSAATSTSNEINIKYSEGNAGRTGCSSSVANCGGVKGSSSQTSNMEQQSSLKAESSSSSQSETSGSKSGSRVILYPQPQQPIPNPSVQESRKTPCPKEKQQSLPPRPNPSPVTGGIQTSNMEQQSSLNAESSSSSQSETTGSKSGSRVILYPQPQQPIHNPSVQGSRKTPSQVTGNIQTSNIEQQSSLNAESTSSSQSETTGSKSGSRVILYPQPQQPIHNPSVQESRKTPSQVTGNIQTSNIEQQSFLNAESSSSSQSETTGSKSGSRVILYPQPQQPIHNPSVQESKKTPSQVTGNIQTSNIEQQSSLNAESYSSSQSETTGSKSGSKVILYPQPQQPIPNPSVQESRKTPSQVTGNIQTSNIQQQSSLNAESTSSSQSETTGSKSGSRVILYHQPQQPNHNPSVQESRKTPSQVTGNIQTSNIQQQSSLNAESSSSSQSETTGSKSGSRVILYPQPQQPFPNPSVQESRKTPSQVTGNIQTSNMEQQSSLKAESSSSSQSEANASKSGSRVILYPQPQQPIPSPSVEESRKTPCPKEKQQSLPPPPNPSPVTGGIQTSNMEQQASFKAESSSSSQSDSTGSKSGSRVILHPQLQQPIPNPSVQESRKTPCPKEKQQSLPPRPNPTPVTGGIQTSNMEQQSSLKAESSSSSQSETTGSKSGSKVILYPQPQQPIPNPSVQESRKTSCPKEKQQSLPSRPNPSPVTGGIQTSNMEQKSSLKAESSSSSQSETAGSKSGSRVVLYPQLQIMKPLPLIPHLSRSKSGVILNPLLQRQSQLLTPNPSPSILKPKHAKTQPIIQIAKLKLQSKPCNPKTQITKPKSQSKPCKQKIDSARAKPLPKLKQCSCGPSIPKSSLPKCKNCCHRRNKRSTDDDEAPPTVEGDNGNDAGESTDAEGRCGRGYGGRRPSFWRIFGR